MSRPAQVDRKGRSSAGPRQLVVVVGTGTGVGKTWVTARMIEGLRLVGTSASVRKPVQSFAPDSADPTDAEVLATASGEDADLVCAESNRFPLAMAPPMAAAALGRSIATIAELCAELDWSAEPADVGFVETVGGTRSPLAADADSGDLVRALNPDVVVVVADPSLGVIDSTRSAVDAVAPHHPIVFLNRFDAADDLHRRNLEWLTNHDGFAVVASIDALVERALGAIP